MFYITQLISFLFITQAFNNKIIELHLQLSTPTLSIF